MMEQGGGAAEFYSLVVLTVALAAGTPLLLARVTRRSRGWWCGCAVLLAAGAGWRRVRPGAAAWAAASAVFDPYEILGLDPTANATAVKRRYRSLARTLHPDKNGDAATFRRVAQAHAALAGDAAARANYERHGHPDGPRPAVFGVALPEGSEGAVLAAYLFRCRR